MTTSLKPDIELAYRKLSILDTKVTAILRVSTTLLSVAVAGLGFVAHSASPSPQLKHFVTAITLSFLLSAIFAMVVLGVNWEPTPKIIKVRTNCFWIAYVVTLTGLVLVGILIFHFVLA